jgi:poly(A) RNA polymerase
MFVLKQWSKSWKVYNPSGGLSAYCLNLLLVFFLQMRSPAVVPNLQANNDKQRHDVCGYNCHFEPCPKDWHSENQESLGHLLVQFFAFYLHFNFTKYAVSVRCGKPILKPKHFSGSCMCVEDPFEIGTLESFIVMLYYNSSLFVLLHSYHCFVLQISTVLDW